MTARADAPDAVATLVDAEPWNQTPLHTAAYHFSAESAGVLLAAGADVNARDVDGETPPSVESGESDRGSVGVGPRRPDGATRGRRGSGEAPSEEGEYRAGCRLRSCGRVPTMGRFERRFRWLAGAVACAAFGTVAGAQGESAQDQRAERIEAVADRPAPETFRDCPSCPELVVIPAGEFRMGSPSSEEGRFDNEGPRRRVRVERFALGRYEVTQAEYRVFEAATEHYGGRCYAWVDRDFPRTDEHPDVCVSWDDAQAYVRWLSGATGRSYRLPSEAEWEYAARAGTSTSRYWGDGESAQCVHANGADASAKRRFARLAAASCDDGQVFTAPVGTFGANRFGLSDMLGNVWEWVEDCWHDHYGGAPSDGRAWTDGGYCRRRVLRGGSWDHDPWDLRAATRYELVAEDRNDDLGFRVARTLE